MKIAVIAHLRHPIAEPFKGGVEAHTHRLVQSLMRRGHEVKLWASGDSDPQLPVTPAIPIHYDEILPWATWRGSDRLNNLLDDAYETALRQILAGGFDVVHNNSLHRFPPRASAALGLPMLSAMHVPPFFPLDRALMDANHPAHIATVTSAHQADLWSGVANLEVVHNGIDTDTFRFHAEGDGTAVWAGRIQANKAPDLAAMACHKAGIPLRIFGAIEDQTYFQHKLRPLLYGPVRYEGEAQHTALPGIFGRASVFVFTPVWDEPFGLVAAEAMACGLPVAGFAAGAVPEVVGPAGVCVKVGGVDALAVAMVQAMSIPRPHARTYAVASFRQERMIDDYERLYRKAIRGAQSAAPRPSFAPPQLPCFGDVAA